MSAKLATKPSRALLTQLESMLDEVQTPECRHWLEQELEGYSLCSHLPWYRIVACRQRGHFLDLKTGKYLTCHINSQTLRKVRTSIPRTKNENFSHLISMGYQ